ncbi:MAG: SUMF1/EgtB/PvdO family nonheme iron enzyme [Phycisphaerae bacterium]|nr:SUMF1/EgtB/PvdO family nonheme iron enzyme [Phycisphaerae bacterium]
MRTVSILTIGCLLVLGSGVAMAQNNPPVVSNVTANQPTACAVVNIGYDLADADADACTVWVAISLDAGVTWSVPVLSLTGDVGAGITPGAGKLIVWDARLDIPGLSGSSFQVRVFADDLQGTGPIMFIPPGTFQMGDPWNEGGSDELPVHTVILSGFWIGRYEVNNTQYAEFLNGGGNDDHWVADQKITRVSDGYGGYIYTVVPGFEQHPVVYVNYDDATAYCVWKSTVTGGTYRLPTEAEWEYAAAWDPTIRKHYRYGFHSDSISGPWANYQSSGDPWDSGPSPETTPGGFYDGTLQQKAVWNWPDAMTEYQTQDAKSFYGPRDMSGNVREWCFDWYDSSYYQDYVNAGSPPDPTGPASGTYRVLRGGSWDLTAAYCRSADRDSVTPSIRCSYIGFRCAAGTP